MKYDDASWHYGGDFPSDLPPEAGATHIGMFLAWCLLNGCAGELHLEEFPDQLDQLKGRTITPAQFLISACDEKFTDEDLSAEGNAFAKDYYYHESDIAQYVGDYERMLGDSRNSLYYVADTWENYDRLAPRIASRFQEWKKQKG